MQQQGSRTVNAVYGGFRAGALFHKQLALYYWKGKSIESRKEKMKKIIRTTIKMWTLNFLYFATHVTSVVLKMPQSHQVFIKCSVKHQ